MPSFSVTKSDCEHLENVQPYVADKNSDVANTREDAQLERKLKIKTDLIVLPLSAIAYFLASMGRSDLANAKVAGLADDLNLSDQQYSNIAGFFYVGYLLFQLPSTLLLRKLTPPVQWFLAMLLWGLFTSCLVVARSYATVAGLRVLIGASEALIQGGIYFLAIIYKPRELTKRIALIFSTSALAGACNGLIAYGVEKISLTAIIGRGSGSFFREASNTGESKFRPRLILTLLLDPVFWLLVCIYGGANFGLASLTNFLPAVIEGFGWPPALSQAISVIPYAVAFITTNIWAQVSDLIDQRGIVISCNALLAVIGFTVLLAVKSRVALLIGCCVIMAGMYPTIALTVAWIPTLLPGHMFRASGVALVNAFAQAVSISASQAYRNAAHDYREGQIVALCLMAFASAAAAALRLLIWRRNKAKLALKDTQEANRMRRQTVDELGNKHPDFYFSN